MSEENDNTKEANENITYIKNLQNKESSMSHTALEQGPDEAIGNRHFVPLVGDTQVLDQDRYYRITNNLHLSDARQQMSVFENTMHDYMESLARGERPEGLEDAVLTEYTGASLSPAVALVAANSDIELKFNGRGTFVVPQGTVFAEITLNDGSSSIRTMSTEDWATFVSGNDLNEVPVSRGFRFTQEEALSIGETTPSASEAVDFEAIKDQLNKGSAKAISAAFIDHPGTEFYSNKNGNELILRNTQPMEIQEKDGGLITLPVGTAFAITEKGVSILSPEESVVRIKLSVQLDKARYKASLNKFASAAGKQLETSSSALTEDAASQKNAVNSAGKEVQPSDNGQAIEQDAAALKEQQDKQNQAKNQPQQTSNHYSLFGGMGGLFSRMADKAKNDTDNFKEQAFDYDAPYDPRSANISAANAITHNGKNFIEAMDNYRNALTKHGIPNVPVNELNDRQKYAINSTATIKAAKLQTESTGRAYVASLEPALLSGGESLNNDTELKRALQKAAKTSQAVNQRTNGTHANLPLDDPDNEGALKALSEQFKELSEKLKVLIDKIMTLFKGKGAASAPAPS